MTRDGDRAADDAMYAVHTLVARFANSFDVKAWDDLAACLADAVHTDYSELRGTPPETLTRAEFVASRRLALDALRTHHLAGNVDVRLSGARGEAVVSMVIYRRDAGGQAFDTHCVYTFGVVAEHGRWVICSIVQRVLWNDGEPAIHRGVTKP
jgi:hypothetical protein